MVIVAITEAGALPDEAITVAGKAFPDARVSAVGTVTVILAADAPLAEVDGALAAVVVPLAAAASGAETHLMAVDAALVAVDTPLTEADTASEVAVDMAPVAVARMEAEAGMAVAMVADTGNLHP
jgi:hypothetical protein